MSLGTSVVVANHYWDVWFILCTLLFCLVYRIVGVLLQTFVLNKFRVRKFSLVDQVNIARCMR